MGIVGDHPEAGVRFVLERPLVERPLGVGGVGTPPWMYVYRGDAFTPEARFPLEVRIGAEGDVEVVAAEDVPAEIVEKVRLLFRTLHKQAKDLPGGQPPRKVVRWRGEK